MVLSWISLALASVQAATSNDGLLKNAPAGQLTTKSSQLHYTPSRRPKVNSPLYEFQWYLHNNTRTGQDLNVQKVWAMDITGKGVTVAIVDDGVMFDHPDLKDNYNSEASYDFIGNDSDASPSAPQFNHGTRCAGVVAAGNNKECGVGVAYNSHFSSIRLQGKNVPDEAYSKALTYKHDINDIYSCSWTITNTTKDYSSLPTEISGALKLGAELGRHKNGSLYVFASGNNHLEGGVCSFNGYVNDIHTIGVGAIDYFGHHSNISETCAGLLVSAYSTLYTTDTQLMPGHDLNFLRINGPKKCTATFDGTSAAAATVSGVLALLLEKYPGLSWRDVQHLLVKSAAPVQPSHPSWEPTYAGRSHSTHFGFGRIDALQLITNAAKHVPAKSQGVHQFQVNEMANIPQRGYSLLSCVDVPSSFLLEHVTVTLNIAHTGRGKLGVSLKSPNNVVSPLVSPRYLDNSIEGLHGLNVLTLKHWDEPTQGTWCLTTTDFAAAGQGFLLGWTINFHGAATETKSNTATAITSEILTPIKDNTLFKHLAYSPPADITHQQANIPAQEKRISQAIPSPETVNVLQQKTPDHVNLPLSPETVNVLQQKTPDHANLPLSPETTNASQQKTPVQVIPLPETVNLPQQKTSVQAKPTPPPETTNGSQQKTPVQAKPTPPPKTVNLPQQKTSVQAKPTPPPETTNGSQQKKLGQVIPLPETANTHQEKDRPDQVTPKHLATLPSDLPIQENPSQSKEKDSITDHNNSSPGFTSNPHKDENTSPITPIKEKPISVGLDKETVPQKNRPISPVQVQKPDSDQATPPATALTGKKEKAGHSDLSAHQAEYQTHSETFSETLMETERSHVMLIIGVASLASFILASFFIFRNCRRNSHRFKQT